MDVITAILNGELDDFAYLEFAEGVTETENIISIYKPVKPSFGLKYVPRTWNSKILSFWKHLVFISSPGDPYFFFHLKGYGNVTIITVFVEDLLFGR